MNEKIITSLTIIMNMTASLGMKINVFKTYQENEYQKVLLFYVVVIMTISNKNKFLKFVARNII